MFRPYSPETHGDLRNYITSREDEGAENLFSGPEHFLELKEQGLLLPGLTTLRVDQSPLPDKTYTVTSTYQLEGRTMGQNMSVGPAQGFHEPTDILTGRLWSIYDTQHTSNE